MKKTLILIAILTTVSCSLQREYARSIENSFKIDFQEFFKNEKTTLYINDCIIFSKRKLMSDKTIGFTNMVVEFKNIDNDIYFFLNKKKGTKVKCQINVNSIDVKIIVDNTESLFNINLNKGKYLGFSKESNNKVQMDQSFDKFFYD